MMDPQYETALGEPFSLQMAKDKAAIRRAKKDAQAKQFEAKAAAQAEPKPNLIVVIGLTAVSVLFISSMFKKRK